MSATTNGKALYENLDTTFVNLWSLLRNLTQRGFIGRVRVELPNYSADIFMTGSSTPLVHEIDDAAGTERLEETALHRVVLRTRETPGKISVFEGADQAVAVQTTATNSSNGTESLDSEASFYAEPAQPISYPPAIFVSNEEFDIPEANVFPEKLSQSVSSPPTDSQLQVTVALGGELIGGVERGVIAVGENFNSLFHDVRLEMADDFSFLDPFSNAFQYRNGVASLNGDVSASVYVSGLSEALRRIVDRVAAGDRARRVRERIAIELMGVARKRGQALEHSSFRMQLDRIAGTKVI